MTTKYVANDLMRLKVPDVSVYADSRGVPATSGSGQRRHRPAASVSVSSEPADWPASEPA